MARTPLQVGLLAGGNPQIAKANGAAPVRAYIAAMPGWKRDVGRRLDRLICETVPDVCKAMKWNSPLYGVKRHGYFLGYHCLTKYVKVAFFRGAELKPMPPGVSKHEGVRYFDIYEDTTLDEALMIEWIRQASLSYLGFSCGGSWLCVLDGPRPASVFHARQECTRRCGSSVARDVTSPTASW